MDLEAIKEEMVAGLEALYDGLEPYRMVARAVSGLGARELVATYYEYPNLHELYGHVVEQIEAAATPEKGLAAYCQLNPQVAQGE